MNFSSIKLGVAIPSRPMRQTAYFEGRLHRVWSVLRQRLQGVCSRCLRVGSLLVNQEVDTGCTPLAGGGGGPAEAGPPVCALLELGIGLDADLGHVEAEILVLRGRAQAHRRLEDEPDHEAGDKDEGAD